MEFENQPLLSERQRAVSSNSVNGSTCVEDLKNFGHSNGIPLVVIIDECDSSEMFLERSSPRLSFSKARLRKGNGKEKNVEKGYVHTLCSPL